MAPPEHANDAPRSRLPSGTVTLLFSDVEGSTRLLAELGDRYAGLISDYLRLMRAQIAAHDGAEIDTAGDGVFCAFSSAHAGLMAALAAQRSFAAQEWPHGGELRVRMALHTGEPSSSATGYVGMDVHRAARIAAAGHGGQVLLSQTTRDLLDGDRPEELTLLDLGEHWLKDLTHPERLFQASAPGHSASFPPLRSLTSMPNNLPRNLSSFVGRRREIDEARALLDQAPLVTLTGPGGVGKTRLALQVAAEALDAFEDGAWLAELAMLPDETLLGETLLAALGIGASPDLPAGEALVQHLRQRRLLLIIDNCEHLIEGCARLADRLLRSSAGLRILATSREALGISGESLYPVPSLTLPETDRIASPERLLEVEAVRLFVYRAGAVAPHFELTTGNAPAVAQICRRLDGIPLAIELAAARVKALPPEQIAARLDDRFRLLSGGSRMALPRHQTLRAAIDWSFDLLTDPERALLRRLSAFAGAFTLEAVEAICAADPVEADDVLDLLTHLVDKSLVVVESTTSNGGYRLLEIIRERGRERLIDAGEAEATRQRHRDWYAALVDRAKPDFFSGPEPAHWLRRFDSEHDNLRSALEWSIEREEHDVALRLAAGLWRFWEVRGHLAEGRQWLERVLSSTAGELSELRANALTGAGILAAMQGDYAASYRFHEASLEQHQRLGNQASISYATNNLANVAVQQGDFDRARELYRNCLALSREIGDERGAGFTITHLADIADRRDNYGEAQRLYEEAASIFSSQGDRWATAHTLALQGSTAARHADVGTAAELYGRAMAISEDLGDARGMARLLALQADLGEAQGDHDAARRLLRSALELRLAMGDKPGTAATLERLAAAEATGGDPERATAILAAADRVRTDIGVRLPLAERAVHDRALAALEDQLGPDAFAAAWWRGTAEPLDTLLSGATPQARV